MLTEFKRVKHGELPGDISRKKAIRLREKGGGFFVWPWQFITKAQGKAFQKFLQLKSKTRQRRRDRQAIKDGLE